MCVPATHTGLHEVRTTGCQRKRSNSHRDRELGHLGDGGGVYPAAADGCHCHFVRGI